MAKFYALHSFAWFQLFKLMRLTFVCGLLYGYMRENLEEFNYGESYELFKVAKNKC